MPSLACFFGDRGEFASRIEAIHHELDRLHVQSHNIRNQLLNFLYQGSGLGLHVCASTSDEMFLVLEYGDYRDKALCFKLNDVLGIKNSYLSYFRTNLALCGAINRGFDSYVDLLRGWHELHEKIFYNQLDLNMRLQNRQEFVNNILNRTASSYGEGSGFSFFTNSQVGSNFQVGSNLQVGCQGGNLSSTCY